jgi:hypothetical protein
LRIMVHGEPGVGKSVLAGTAPKALILANRPDEVASAAIHKSKADVWVMDSFRDLEDAYEYVRHEGVHEYEWLWIDNGTLLQDQMMDEIMVDLKAAHSHRSRWTPDKPQYGETQTKLGVMVRQFSALPIHFGMTAHTERFERDDDRVEYLPMFQGGNGKFSSKLCGYMNVVGYYSVARKGGKSVRTLYVDKRTKFYAKDRYAITKDGKMVDPTIPKLMEGIAKVLPSLGEKAAPAARRTAKKSTAPIKKAGTARRTTNRRTG